MNSASTRGRYVLPTPVGPRNMNTPIGRFGSLSPARERRTAFAIALIASSWPMTRLCSTSSIWSSRADSSLRDARDGDARPHAHDLGDVVLGDDGLRRPRAAPRCPCSSDSIFSCSFTSRSRSSAAYSYCCDEIAASFSLRSDSSPRVASFSEGGVAERRIRTRLEASSTRSMALSGRNRSET